MKLWRPKFSVRTLAIFVTLVCAYFGAWELTKKYGTTAEGRWQKLLDGTMPWLLESPSSPAPFVVVKNVYEFHYESDSWRRCRAYHFWLFGAMIRLPVETDGPKNWPLVIRYTQLVSNN